MSEDMKNLFNKVETAHQKAFGCSNGKDYDVGYKKPPKETRFKKGQSGNPKGRKKKVIPETLQEAITFELAELREIKNPDGQTVKLRVYEILARKFVQDAIMKDGQARRLIVEDMCRLNFLEILKVARNKISPQETSLTPEETELLKKRLYDLMLLHAQQENSDEF